jgi:aryl-alcohol dehydrogenase-like predicted oxidoreductase
MSMKRREFLAATALGMGGLMMGAPSRPALAQAVKHDPVEVVELGKTGIKISKVGLGTGMRGWQRGSNQTRMGEDRFNTLARGAFERGIRLMDGADLYGTHSYIAEAYKDFKREDYVLISKIWFRPDGLQEKERLSATECVERFLREYRTEYIDVLQMHCVTSPDWRTELSEYMQDLDKLKERGLIRSHGCSFHSLEALAASTEESWVDSVHARINPYAVKMDVKTAEEVPKVAEILKTLRSQGKGVIGMKIIGEGEFRDDEEKRDHSISYAFNSGCVDAMIVGFEKSEEIDDFESRVKRAPVEVA